MKITDLLELILLAAIWGASFLFVRVTAPILHPVLLIELRVLISGIAMLILSMRLNLVGKIRQHLIPLFILGCINLTIPFLLFAFAALYLPAGFTAILNATAPLSGTIIAFVWLREKLTLSIFSGLILGFAGVTILVGWTSMPMTPGFIGATIAGLSAALMYAIATAYVKQKLAKVPPIAIATGSQLCSALTLLPLAPFFLPTTPPSREVILIVLALALLSTAIAYILYFRLVKNVGASKALIVTYLSPLFAIFWGATILNESVTISMILGCGLILSGTAIALYK
ncbi:membrane protein [Chondrocystis sp. NIES-4102]|nr:membrane protein [Chondrocystis sp. NIES-4102]